MAYNVQPSSGCANVLKVNAISDIHLNLLPLWNSTLHVSTDVSIGCKDGQRKNVTRDQESTWPNITCGRCDVNLPANSGTFGWHNATLPTAAAATTAVGASRQLHLVHATLVIYTAVFLFGFVGNSLVIVVILKHSAIRRRSIANYYILNLAVADELHLLTLPFFCVATYTANWSFGDVACKLSHVFRDANRFAGLLTLVALTVDRCLATCRNGSRYRSLPVGLAVCLLIWIVSLSTSWPYFINARVLPVTSPAASGSGVDQRYSCRIVWQQYPIWVRRTCIYVQLVLGLIVPFAVVAGTNMLLFFRLRSRLLCRLRQSPAPEPLTSGRSLPTTAAAAAVEVNSQSIHRAGLPSTVTAEAVLTISKPFRSRIKQRQTRVTLVEPTSPAVCQQQRQTTNHKSAALRAVSTAKMVLVVVVVFVSFQLPYHAVEIASLVTHERYLVDRKMPNTNWHLVFVYANVVAQVMMFACSCCNPFVYGIFNSNYRHLFASVLPCRRQRTTVVSASTSLIDRDARRQRKTTLAYNSQTSVAGGRTCYVMATKAQGTSHVAAGNRSPTEAGAIVIAHTAVAWQPNKSESVAEAASAAAIDERDAALVAPASQ